MHTIHMIELFFYLIRIAVNIYLFLHFVLFTLVVNENEKIIETLKKTVKLMKS